MPQGGVGQVHVRLSIAMRSLRVVMAASSSAVAETPVVTPSRGSMLTVKVVWWRMLLLCAVSCRAITSEG